MLCCVLLIAPAVLTEVVLSFFSVLLIKRRDRLRKLHLTHFVPNRCDTVCEGHVVSMVEVGKAWKLA